jgi:hypothetical protein
MKRVLISLPLILASFFIASCDNETKRSLGIIRKTPDEYTVLKHPPLSVPPSFELNPPGEKSKPRKGDLEVKFTKKKESISGKNTKKDVSKKTYSESMSGGDKKFSSKFKKYKKRSDIREVLKEEGVKEEKQQLELDKKKKDSAWEKIKSWF